MRKRRVWTGTERRSSERICDDSILKVRGRDKWSKPFLETTTIYNVSSNGIAFYLEAEVEVQSEVVVEICSREGNDTVLSPLFSGKFRVLRVSAEEMSNDLFLVAACLLGTFSQLRKLGGTEEFADDLRRAVELDEEARSVFTEGS